jgi:hypothetical protein
MGYPPYGTGWGALEVQGTHTGGEGRYEGLVRVERAPSMGQRQGVRSENHARGPSSSRRAAGLDVARRGGCADERRNGPRGPRRG